MTSYNSYLLPLLRLVFVGVGCSMQGRGFKKQSRIANNTCKKVGPTAPSRAVLSPA
jgi:hypothetical protein